MRGTVGVEQTMWWYHITRLNWQKQYVAGLATAVAAILTAIAGDKLWVTISKWE